MATKRTISADEKRWRAEEALRTLSRADEIRANKSLMRDVQAHAKAQVAALNKVAGGTTRSRKK